MASAKEFSESALDGGGLAKVRDGSFHRVLVPVDPSGSLSEALAVVAGVCRASDGQARLVHVRVWDQHSRSAGKYFTETSEEATATLDDIVTRARATGLQVSGVVVESNRPLVARTILAEAAAWGADAIVLTVPPRRSLGALLSGSVSARIKRKASCPVLWASSGAPDLHSQDSRPEAGGGGTQETVHSPVARTAVRT
jgi:nucleotide-binding universal stress UspA family protein